MESSYLVAECDGVDRSEMVVVLLHQLPTPGVILEDLLVTHAGQKLMRSARIDAHNVRRLASSEFVEAFACFRVP
jgi:hypothetical protein